MSDPTEPSDAALIAAYVAGDERAFEVLYRRHRDWVVRLALRSCGNREDALDVLQDAFAYLARRAPDLVLRHRLTSLLYPVIQHLARDRRKRAARRRPLDEADEPFEWPLVPDEVRVMFAGLGSLQREVLGLRFADDLALEQIAELLEIPVGTVKSRLHNALQQLREKLKRE